MLFDRGLTVLISIVILLIGLMFYLGYKAEVNCKAQGGHIEGDGTYTTTTTYVSSGNTMVPVITTTENLQCVK